MGLTKKELEKINYKLKNNILKPKSRKEIIKTIEILLKNETVTFHRIDLQILLEELKK